MNLGITQTPLATRASAPGWRDPRLWLGLAIVAASVLAGALVLGTSDDTVPVWSASDSFGAGHLLSGHDLVVRRVRFADAGSADLYFRADQQLPADLRLTRDVGSGELLPRAAVSPVSSRDVRQVPVSVSPDQVPGSLRVGDRVDVYVRPASGAGCADPTGCDGSPVVSGVTVLDAPGATDDLGSDGTRSLVLGMSGPETQAFFSALEAAGDPALTVVGRS